MSFFVSASLTACVSPRVRQSLLYPCLSAILSAQFLVLSSLAYGKTSPNSSVSPRRKDKAIPSLLFSLLPSSVSFSLPHCLPPSSISLPHSAGPSVRPASPRSLATLLLVQSDQRQCLMGSCSDGTTSSISSQYRNRLRTTFNDDI